MNRLRILLAAVALTGISVGQADAQYYGGYGYGPPGSRCNAFLRTPYGPRHVVCPMGRPKPVGAHCACPPPGPYAPTAFGRVIP